MNFLNYKELSKEMLEQLEKGAFLTVKNDEKVNSMTIGWGNIGYIWNKPIFTVLVRHSRYTYEMLKDTNEFTISVPLNADMSKELEVCGTQSGRDIDKVKELNLNLKDSVSINTPILDDCDLHFECKIVLRQTMEPELFDKKLNDAKYPNKDYHVIYYGEIVKTYTN